MTIRLALLLGALWASAGTAAVSAQAPAMSVSTRVDKTALWVGDQLHYQIFVDHPADVEFVLDNLNKETIQLDPFRVVDVASSTVGLTNGRKRLFVDVTLANFTTGVGAVQIPQLNLFYFRRGAGTSAQAGGAGAAAESLTIPGPLVGVRSTLPPDSTELRDAVTVNRWPRSRRLVAAIGWCALVGLLVGGSWEGVRLIRRRGRRHGPDPRKAMSAIRKRWAQGVPDELADPAVVRQFYDRSSRDVKEYLGYLLDTPTEGLTSEELREEMRRSAVSPELAERVVAVVAACETACYQPSGTEPGADAARAVARQIEDIFEAS